MKLKRNLNLQQKIVLIPFIALTVTLILFIINVYMAARDISALEEPFRQGFEKSAVISELVKNLETTQGNLNKFLSWSTTGVSGKTVNNLVETIRDDNAEFLALIGTLQSKFELTGEETEMLSLMEEQAQTYIKSSEEVIEMTSLDTSMGVMSMGAAEDHYNKLGEQLFQASELFKEKGLNDFVSQKLGARTRQILGLGVFFVVFVVAAFLTYQNVRSVFRPLDEIKGVLVRLADGETGINIPATERRDEVGEIARAAEVFKDNAVKNAEAQARREKETAARAEKVMQYANEFDVASSEFLQRLLDSAAELNGDAQKMLEYTEDSGVKMRSIASSAEETADAAQKVASAAEELNASIREVDAQARGSTEISAKAVRQVNQSGESLEELARVAENISSVISLINDIAEKTNLLALNATIEAARAGDAGKGFAVVATEVKNLAEQTAKATGDISEQIAQMQDVSDRAQGAFRDIRDVIDEINRYAQNICATVEQQTSATQEISRAIQESASYAQGICADIEEASKQVEHNKIAADRTKESSVALRQMSGQIGEDTKDFLRRMRSV